MIIKINGKAVYDSDAPSSDIYSLTDSSNAHTVKVLPALSPEKEKLLKRVLPEIIGIAGITSVTSLISNPAAVFASTATASTKLLSKEQSIIGLLQSIAVPASIAIALWGLIEWAVLNNPHGKKKIWESLWLLIGIKFIPDIWMAVAS